MLLSSPFEMRGILFIDIMTQKPWFHVTSKNCECLVANDTIKLYKFVAM